MTAAAATGRGMARQTCLHSLDHARARGYRAMQFNLVVINNERAVQLWQSLGFEIVRRLPLAFNTACPNDPTYAASLTASVCRISRGKEKWCGRRDSNPHDVTAPGF